MLLDTSDDIHVNMPNYVNLKKKMKTNFLTIVFENFHNKSLFLQTLEIYRFDDSSPTPILLSMSSIIKT